MPARLLLVNVVLGIVGLVFAVVLARELVTSRPLPAPPTARAAQPAPAAGAAPAPARRAGADLSAYNLIPARNLFNPARSETAAAAAARPAVKPVLHGVVIDGPRSRAYLEDPAAKRVFSYTVGDTVGLGRIETISGDRVVITGPEGTFEVLLNDPSKPKPAPPAAVAVPGAPRPPAAPAAPAVRRPAPGALPGQPPAAGSQPGQ